MAYQAIFATFLVPMKAPGVVICDSFLLLFKCENYRNIVPGPTPGYGPVQALPE